MSEKKRNWDGSSKKIKEIAHQLSWQEFTNMEVAEKISFLNNSKTGNPFHVIFSQQFNRTSLSSICEVAEKARLIHKDRVKGRKFLKSLLFGTYALNFFTQPSSRTFLSFTTAEEILGIGIRDIRDPDTSSEAKGESLEDSIRTVSSYVDLMVMRHHEEKAAEMGGWVLNKSDRRIPIINAGSGADQHPTQALTDIYTLSKSFEGNIDGKTIVMVGDLSRGRTVRSLSYLMKNYSDMKLIFVSPPYLKMKDDIKTFLSSHKIPFEEADNLEEVVHLADIIYMTRIQDEWDKKGLKPVPVNDNLARIKAELDEKAAAAKIKTHKPVDPKYRFKKEFLDNKMKSHAVLMHPLPKRDEIDEEVSYSRDPRVLFWRQERNGMWIKVALIATIFKKAQEILDYKLVT